MRGRELLPLDVEVGQTALTAAALEVCGVAAGATALGVRVVDREPRLLKTVDVVDLGPPEIWRAHLVGSDLDSVEARHLVIVEFAIVEVEGVAKAGASARLNGNAQGVFLALVVLWSGRDLSVQKLRDLRGGRLGDLNGFCGGGHQRSSLES